MSDERLFLDTSYVLGLLNRRDRYHGAARKNLARVESASLVVTTEAVLVEIGNAFSALDRAAAHDFIRDCYTTHGMTVKGVDTALLLLFWFTGKWTNGLAELVSIG